MKKFLQYLITALVGAVIVVAVVSAQKIWAQDGVTAKMGTLSDAFFAAGIFIGCIGLLVFVSDRGAFDMLKYAVIMFISKFKRDVTKRKYKDYNEYRAARSERENKPIAFMLIVGAAFLAVALVFLILYFQI